MAIADEVHPHAVVRLMWHGIVSLTRGHLVMATFTVARGCDMETRAISPSARVGHARE